MRWGCEGEVGVLDGFLGALSLDCGIREATQADRRSFCAALRMHGHSRHLRASYVPRHCARVNGISSCC